MVPSAERGSPNGRKFILVRGARCSNHDLSFNQGRWVLLISLFCFHCLRWITRECDNPMTSGFCKQIQPHIVIKFDKLVCKTYQTIEEFLSDNPGIMERWDQEYFCRSLELKYECAKCGSRFSVPERIHQESPICIHCGVRMNEWGTVLVLW